MEVGLGKREEMWRKKEKRKRNRGEEGVFIFFQWLKDRKVLELATSSDKIGRNAGKPMETHVTLQVVASPGAL